MLGSGATEVSLIRKNEFRDHRIEAYHCRRCSFMGLHRMENERRPYVSVQELVDCADTQDA
jgi:hypothetical protein